MGHISTPSLVNGIEGLPFPRGAFPPGEASIAFSNKKREPCTKLWPALPSVIAKEAFGLSKPDQKFPFSGPAHRFPVLALIF